MIFDAIANLKHYGIPKAEAIARFIAEHDCLNLPNGEIPIEGKDLFVKVMEYEPKPLDQARFETHRVHADVQYIVRGVELMQIARPQDLTPTTEYDSVGDYQFYTARPEGITALVVQSGEFTVFYPGKPHRPSCLYQNHKAKVKKLVFKIKIH